MRSCLDIWAQLDAVCKPAPCSSISRGEPGVSRRALLDRPRCSGPECEASRHMTDHDWGQNPWVALINHPPLNDRPALIRRFRTHGGPVSAVALTSDGSTAVSGSRDGTIRAWDVISG